MEKIILKKQEYDKLQFTNTIDTNFTQLANTVSTTSTDPQVLVDQFFKDYQDLFFDIPKFGNTNSHEYLIQTSQEYIGPPDPEVDGTVQALIEEIDSLRQQNLTLQQTQIKQTLSSVQESLKNLKIDV